MYGQCLRAISRDCLEDGIGCPGPDEWLGVVIVGLNEGSDIGLERGWRASQALTGGALWVA